MRNLPGLRSLRGRLVALLLLGAVPLAAMAGVVAWQNYQATFARAEQRVLLVEQAASVRHAAAIDEVRQELGAIATTPGLLAMPDACTRVLDSAMMLRQARYFGLEAIDDQGQLRCVASTVPQHVLAASRVSLPLSVSPRPPLRLLPPEPGFTVHARRGPGGHVLIQAEYPVIEAHKLAGSLIALLRVDWFEHPYRGLPGRHAIWLIDPGGRMIPAMGAAEPLALPPPAKLRRLLASGPELVTERSGSGRPFFYAVGDLGGGLRLLVAEEAGGTLAHARDILLDRLFGLALLMVLGVAAAATGANLALVQPIERLTAAVDRWRTGVRFEAAQLADVPVELDGLCRAFGQATEALGRREGQLRGAREQQELLAQEMHHRVKNNLQVVASLLNLQASRIRQPEARAEFQSARDRVRALATLHRHLYLQGELQAINMRSFLTELCEQLLQALGPSAGDRISLDIEAADLRIASDQAVPLALIVTETVGNAVKYAFPGERQGHILVRLTAVGDEARVVIADDGIGVPAGRVDTETGVRDGIGMQLVRGLARQLAATLTVSEGDGTRYEIVMRLAPVNAKPAPAEAIG